MGQQSSVRIERTETKGDGTYVWNGRRPKPLVFRGGLRVDSNIVDDSDYFLYHLFRMSEVISSKLQKTSSPRQVPRRASPDISPLASARIEHTETPPNSARQPSRVHLLLLQNGQLVRSPSRQEFDQLLGDYQDQTGYKSKIRLQDIQTLAVECGQAFLQNGLETTYPAELIRNYVTYPAHYYYNYRPCPQSLLPISLARALGWHQNWFRLPGAMLHLNEWGYLLETGLPLFEVAHGSLLRDGRVGQQKSFSWYLADGLEQDKSGVTLTAALIQRSIARSTGLNNLLVNDTISRILIVDESLPASAIQTKLNLQQQISSATR